MRFPARYYDGQRSTATDVEVVLEHNQLCFQYEDTVLKFSGPAFTLQPALGKTSRVIELNTGGRLEFDYLPGLDDAALQAAGIWRWIYKLENNLAYVAAAILLIIALIASFISYGVPFISEQVADALPLETEAVLGRQVLQSMEMESKIFEPSTVQKSRQAAIEKSLQQLCRTQSTCPTYQLLFKKSPWLGANAFALPGGYIVVTDDLVALAKDDEEILAVLSHELGHIVRRHVMRQILQSTLSGLIMVAIVGDFDSIASGLPATLMNMRYSRNMEKEADLFALEAMQKSCITPAKFASILERLANSRPDVHEEGTASNKLASLFSTHPDTQSRLIQFKQARLSGCGN